MFIIGEKVLVNRSNNESAEGFILEKAEYKNLYNTRIEKEYDIQFDDGTVNKYREEYLVKINSLENHLLYQEREGIDDDCIVRFESIEYLEEMATVARNYQNGFCIVVNPDRKHNDSYIKVYNHTNYHAATKVIRLAFTKLKYYDHKTPDKSLWHVTKKELKQIKDFLMEKPTSKGSQNFNTNWDYAIYLWNNECEFTDHSDYDENFPMGCLKNSELLNDPQFVPLNTKIPDYENLNIK